MTAATSEDLSSAMKGTLETWRGSLAMMPDIIREASYPTPWSASPLLPMLLLSLAKQKNSPDTKTSFLPEYDFIVVGAGSAGSVIASRLSEKTCVSLLLLEAGKAPPLMTDIPAISQSYAGTDIDWNYKTVPQKNAAHALINRQVPFFKAKAIGGCSISNGMLYNRGHRKDYDNWAAAGAKGWSWNEVFPFFLESENNTDPRFANSGYHSVHGPMTVSRLEIDPKFREVIPEVASNLGYSFTDASGPGQIGISDLQANVRDSQRCSTAKAYLVPAENRPNLDIVKEAFVTKVLIKDSRAVGVEFDYNGLRYMVKSRKEVIVSAGGINTPKLLMLSGIGPRETLEKFGIPVYSDLPVGQNFQDHYGTILNFEINDGSAPKFMQQLLDPSNTLEYINNRTGPLAESNGFVSVSFFTNDDNKDHMAVPDNQEYFFKDVRELLRRRYNIKSLVYDRLYNQSLFNSMILCQAETTHPRSRGDVSIRSADAYDPPVIDPKYFSDPQDLEDVVAGMKMCIKMASTPAMKKFNPRLSRGLMPGCENLSNSEDITWYLRCYALSYVTSICHDSGTAKMGDPSDATTVVDPQLRVKGIDGLRVADASVMPSLPNSNTNNPVIMILEKAADMIKKSFQCTSSVPFSNTSK